MKQLVNILKYLVFLSIGVGLFYLAMLDITRGSMVIEDTSMTFQIDKGYGGCEDGKRSIRFPRVDKKFDQLGFQIRQGEKTIYDGVFSATAQTGDDPWDYVCLEPGTYELILPAPPEEPYSLAIQGVDRTDELINDMKKASIPGLAISFLFGYLAIVSRGIRWQYLLEPMGYKPKVWHSIHSVAFAYFANTFVPRSGELARCAALNQTDDIPVDKLFGTVISERVVDFVMLIIFTSVAVLTNLDAFERILEMGSGSGSTEEGSGSGLWMYLLIALGIFVAAFFLLRRSIAAGKFYQKVLGFLRGVGDGLKSVLQMKQKWAFIGHTFFIWGMYYAMAYVIYMSIDATSHMSVTEALFVMVAGGFGMVLPAPGGIGSYHWTVKLGFIALGMSGALGFAVANVLWLTQTIMIIVGGGIGYLMLMVYRIRKTKMEAANVGE